MNLENLNLVELNAQELEEVEGGGIFNLILLVALVTLAYFTNKNNPERVDPDWNPGYLSDGANYSIDANVI